MHVYVCVRNTVKPPNKLVERLSFSQRFSIGKSLKTGKERLKSLKQYILHTYLILMCFFSIARTKLCTKCIMIDYSYDIVIHYPSECSIVVS